MFPLPFEWCIPYNQWWLNVKNIGVTVVIDGDNLPSQVRIGLTDLPNIGGASGPPSSGTTGIKYQPFGTKNSQNDCIYEIRYRLIDAS